MTGSTDAAAALGPPAAPLPFDGIVFKSAQRVMKPVHVQVPRDDEADGASTSTSQMDKIPDRPSMGLQRAESMSGNVLVVLDEGDGGLDQARRAYWIQRKISKTTNGSVRIGYVLRRREVEEQQGGGGDDYNAHGDIPWEVTPADASAYEMVAIKMYEKSKCTGTKANGPAVEIAASQLLARHAGNPAFHHVLGTVDMLSDERFVYLVMPYCDGGDLLSVLESRGRLEESIARHVFKQILSVSTLLYWTLTATRFAGHLWVVPRFFLFTHLLIYLYKCTLFSPIFLLIGARIFPKRRTVSSRCVPGTHYDPRRRLLPFWKSKLSTNPLQFVIKRGIWGRTAHCGSRNRYCSETHCTPRAVRPTSVHGTCDAGQH